MSVRSYYWEATMPQRLMKKSVRLDTTVSCWTLKEMAVLGRKIERSSERRFAVSRTEVLEIAVDWMYKQPADRKRELCQVERGKDRAPVHLGLKISERTLERLAKLGETLQTVNGYVRPPHSRSDRPNFGDTIEWCVSHFHGSMVREKQMA